MAGPEDWEIKTFYETMKSFPGSRLSCTDFGEVLQKQYPFLDFQSGFLRDVRYF
jgi:hypothetical protein